MFKERTSKKRIPSSEKKENSTLDAKHNEIIKGFVNDINKVETVEKEILNTKTTLNYWKNQIEIFKIENKTETKLYENAWSCNIFLEDKLKKIEQEYSKLINYKDEITYYEDTASILFNYYNILDKQSTNILSLNNITQKQLKGKKKNIPNINSRNILDALNISCSSNIENSSNEIITDKNISKSELVDAYLSCIDQTYIKAIDGSLTTLCNKCNIQQICLQQESVMLCPNCGAQELLLIEQNRPLFRQQSKEASHFSYRRINHFREWCSQVQGKESTDIPDEIFEKILQEIKKEKIMDTTKISYTKMREILKRLRINKYYEHINYIINRINGVPTPHFTPELEDKLCSMFKEIQGPFLKHRPKDRKNFLSYSYVLYKFFQLLNMENYLKFFPLLKSREKLYVQDQIFKAICEDLKWPIIPSL